MRILAVDDELLALEDFEDTCRELGIHDEIVKFNNPLDALSYVAVNKVDIAFLDIEMPVIKGIELAKRIKALSRNTGARGLRSIIEETMTDIMFDIPSEPDVKKCIIHKECITNDKAPKVVREKVS